MPQKVLIRKNGLLQQYTPKDTSTGAGAGDLVALNANAKIDPTLLTNGVLTGGTVNQVLAKTDSTNYNVKWLTLGTAAFQASTAFATAAQGTLATNAVPSSQKGVANGVATLGSDAKIPANQLPALAITETFVVSSEAAMLALAAQEGDVAVRTDIGKSFIHTNSYLGTMADWQELLTPTAPVQSVNGQIGTVTITPANIGAQVANNNLDGATTFGAALLSASSVAAQRTALGVDASADVVHTTGTENVAGVKTFSDKSVHTSGMQIANAMPIELGTGGAAIQGTAFGSVVIGSVNAVGGSIAIRPRGIGNSTSQILFSNDGSQSWGGDDAAKLATRTSLQAVGLIGDETVAGAKTFTARQFFNIGIQIPASQQLRWGDGTTDFGAITASTVGLTTIAGNLNAGTGGVLIRPTGINSSTGQFAINPDGSTTWSGTNATKAASRTSLGAIGEADLYSLTGWNGTGTNTTVADANDTTLPSRVYRTASTTLNIPVGPGTDGVLTVMRGTGDQLAQTWMSVRDLAGGRTPTPYTRGYYGTTQGWSPWYRSMTSELNLSDLSNTSTARDNLLRVASTTSGNSGSENYWAKIADVSYASAATNYFQLVLLQDFYATSAKSAMLLNFCIRFQSATTASGVIDVMARGSSAAATTNYKITMDPMPDDSTGNVFGIWVKKSAAFDRPYFSELSRTISSTNATTLTYFQNAAWQAEEPVGARGNFTVTSFGPLDSEVVHRTGDETIAGIKTFSNGIVVANGQNATFGTGAGIYGNTNGSLIMGTSTNAGSVLYLRPSGYTSGTNEIQITTDGSMNLTGGGITTAGQIMLAGGSAGAAKVVRIGSSRTADGPSYLDLVSESGRSDYNTRLYRNSGANGETLLTHRGTGSFVINNVDSGPFDVRIAGTSRLRVNADGSVTYGGDAAAKTATRSSLGAVGIGGTETITGLKTFGGEIRTQAAAAGLWMQETTTAEDPGAFMVVNNKVLQVQVREPNFGAYRQQLLQIGLDGGTFGIGSTNVRPLANGVANLGVAAQRWNQVYANAYRVYGEISFNDAAARDLTKRNLQLPITISATAPTSPVTGDIWMDIS